MNHSMYSADHKTHLKVVVVGLLFACFVLIVGIFAHTAQIDLGTAPLVKAGAAALDKRCLRSSCEIELPSEVFLIKTDDFHPVRALSCWIRADQLHSAACLVDRVG